MYVLLLIDPLLIFKNMLCMASFYIEKFEPISQRPLDANNFQFERGIGLRSLLNGKNNMDRLKHGSLDMLKRDDIDQRFVKVVTKADVPKNNVVDLDRIARGLDTRTTLMLRNIPNKVDQKMLKEYIDVTNESTYDFLCKYYSLEKQS